MADGTHIEWTEATWNPITGCSVTSPGCTNCYAMQLAGTRLAHHWSRKGLTQESKAGPVWNGALRFNKEWLDQPLRWERPRMIFVCAHGDLFHESVPDEWIDQIFAVMALCPQHTFQVLTKRSGRMREYFRETTGWRARVAELLNDLKPSPLWNGNVYQGWQNLHGRPDGLPNVWLGVSVEDQQRADERIPDLLATPAAIRWISAEPLLGPVSLHPKADATYQMLSQWYGPDGFDETGSQPVQDRMRGYFPRIDWVVAGGESGKHARPMHPDWARSLRDQCAAAGVPFFFKQWGEWAPGVNINGHVTRTEKTADWFNDRWSFEEITPRMAEELHTDDEPLLWRCGKKRAGRLLDNTEHNQWPARR